MLRKLSPILVAAGVLALPASSLAASRTWVSGVGDDANPCSRTAPCKTFAGAFSKTDAGGEIDALDPGGFGALTITRAVTIDGGGGQVASTLVSGTNGIVVNAGAADHVILRNLRITGLNGAGLNGVDFISGGSLRLENVQIFGFGDSGVSDVSPDSSLVVSGSNVDDNTGDGVLVAPPAGHSAQALLENDSLENNECGVAAGALGGPGPFTTNCGLSTAGSPASGVDVGLDHSSASGNIADGVLSVGSPSTVFLSTATVFGNGTGLATLNGGSIVSVGPNNAAYGNVSNGNPTSTSGPQNVQGPQGATGAPGAPGKPGQVVLITCQTSKQKVKTKMHGKTRTTTKSVQKCKARPITGTVTFTVSGHLSRASLSRDGHVYASGEISGGATNGYLRLHARLRPASYVLTLWQGGRAVSRRTVFVSG